MQIRLALLVVLLGFATHASAVTIDTVLVGDAGNANDSTGFGAVGYEYRIGKYEVTNSQYVEFLNAKDPAGTSKLRLYDPEMTDDQFGGILRASSGSGPIYSVKPGYEQSPAAFVSWYSAIRFANWLNNGQGSADTENGAYTILGGGSTPSNGSQITRNAEATWFLPSENEWYKAAYYQPASQGGDSDDYWLYSTQTNARPYSDQPPGLDAPDQSNTANYLFNDQINNGYNDGWAATGIASALDPNQNYLTDVGAYSTAHSFYGTFDQGGNLHEWNESPFGGGGGRYTRGGAWNSPFSLIGATSRSSHAPILGLSNVGFRVATIPEPSTVALAAVGMLALAGVAMRRSHLPLSAP